MKMYGDDYEVLYYLMSTLGAGVYIVSILVSIFSIVCMWKIFTKAHEEGWAAIVPFYNQYVLFKISWGNGWMFLLTLIPFANFVIMIITYVKLAQAFGKGGGFACGLIFLNPIFMAILAFSNDISYIGAPGQVAYVPGLGYNVNGQWQNPYQNGGAQQSAGYQQQSTYTQQSAQNPDYHYQRSSDSGPTPSRCPGCGAPVEPGSKFCGSCGKQL